MSYCCTLCNYKTNDKRNFNRHENSVKHIKKSVIETKNDESKFQKSETKNDVETNFKKNDTIIFKCDNCKKIFETRSGIYKHKKKCINIICNDNKDKLINDLRAQLEISEYKMKLEISEKEKELYKILEREKTELLNTFMHNANKIINKEQDNTKITAEAMKTVSMSALKYANEKFKDAPALIPLENFSLNNLSFDKEDDKEKLTELLIYHAKQKSLDKLLGDHIVKEYKKDDPKEQAFHTTDSSRLNYIVRELIEDALIWAADKSGIKICSSIVKPLIDKCINLLLEHQKLLLEEMATGNYKVKDTVQTIISVLMSLDKGSLESDINKYIAPFFNLNKN